MPEEMSFFPYLSTKGNLKFADVMMDKPVSYYAFEMLYWTGIRCGELLALTPKDFNFERQELTINKSYQRLNGRDVITTPKTKKSNRTIKMPKFLCEDATYQYHKRSTEELQVKVLEQYKKITEKQRGVRVRGNIIPRLRNTLQINILIFRN